MLLSSFNNILKSQKIGFRSIFEIQKFNFNICSSIACSKRKAHTKSDSSSNYDLVIVGGGIVGVASAREILCKHPKLKIAVVEKEHKLAYHQSGHNSGVIHAGIYYKPGTLKARLCVEGLHLAYEYLNKRGIPYKKCGKLIVATDAVEVERLYDLFERGTKNNVPDMKMIEGKDIKKIEPYCEGIKAIHSPHTGIVDWGLVTVKFGEDFTEAGGDIHLNFKVTDFKDSKDPEYPVAVIGEKNTVKSKYVFTCGGLQSDLLSVMSGCDKEPKIIPFRGEYLLLKKDKSYLVKGNIYPVPNPEFPFLGVHFTPRMDGSIWLGPNAILAFKREGYNFTDVNISELMDAIKFPGFHKLAAKYIVQGGMEVVKSFITPLQVKDLQKFIPQITNADVTRGPAGVRAQAMDVEGNLVDDFVFDSGKGPVGERVLHCRNAPSPGATSSLAIAKMIEEKVNKQFNLAKLK